MDILGFQEFMNRAEKDKLERMRDGDLFSRLLPYAIALDVTDNWAKALKGISQNTPSWYVSPMGPRGFRPLCLFSHSSTRSLHIFNCHVFRTPRKRHGRRGGGGGGGLQEAGSEARGAEAVGKGFLQTTGTTTPHATPPSGKDIPISDHQVARPAQCNPSFSCAFHRTGCVFDPGLKPLDSSAMARLVSMPSWHKKKRGTAWGMNSLMRMTMFPDSRSAPVHLRLDESWRPHPQTSAAVSDEVERARGHGMGKTHPDQSIGQFFIPGGGEEDQPGAHERGETEPDSDPVEDRLAAHMKGPPGLQGSGALHKKRAT